MRYIRIEKSLVEEKRIISKFDVSKDINKFFKSKIFWCEYDEKILEQRQEILNIALICNIVPIAWFTNSDIYIEKIDRNFFESLNEIKSSFEKMYNRRFKSKIIVKELTENKFNAEKSVAFFSGGIDSIGTFIANKEEIEYLFTVCGADIDLSDELGWNRVKTELTEFGEKYNVENIFVKSNLREFINTSELEKQFKDIIAEGWWPKVQHSLGMAGLLAGLVSEKKIKTLYVPSSYTENFNKPWGSDPTIDNKISFCGMTGKHDLYDASRQEKIKLISNYMKEKNDNIFMRVCWQSKGGGNCCKCEKCCRSIIGLILEKNNVKELGFSIPNNFFRYVKFMLKNSVWIFMDDEIYMWKDIQKNINLDLIEKREENEFFEWLKNYNIDSIRENKMKIKNRMIRKFKNIFMTTWY